MKTKSFFTSLFILFSINILFLFVQNKLALADTGPVLPDCASVDPTDPNYYTTVTTNGSTVKIPRECGFYDLMVGFQNAYTQILTWGSGLTGVIWAIMFARKAAEFFEGKTVLWSEIFRMLLNDLKWFGATFAWLPILLWLIRYLVNPDVLIHLQMYIDNVINA